MTRPSRARQNSQRAFRTLKRTLTKVGWAPQAGADPFTLHVDLRADRIPVRRAIAKILPELERFLFFLEFGARVPEPRRPQVAEFIARANYGLIIGNFEMNFDAGRVQYKSSVDFTQVELSSLLIRNAILSAMDAVEHYARFLLAVIKGKLSPVEALALSDEALLAAAST